MSTVGVIVCFNCGGEDFYTRDGVSICSRCQVESTEHGHETALEDESIGAFTGGRTLLTRKSLKKRRGRSGHKSHGYKVSFTSTDALTFIVRGWTEEAIGLGAKPSLTPLVKTLWSRYLQAMGTAFTLDGSEGIGTQSYRDKQVQLLGRKRLLPASQVKRRRNLRRVMTNKRRKEEERRLMKGSSSEEETQSAPRPLMIENPREARAVRKQQKSKLFGFISREGEREDGNNTSTSEASSFLTDTSFMSDGTSGIFDDSIDASGTGTGTGTPARSGSGSRATTTTSGESAGEDDEGRMRSIDMTVGLAEEIIERHCKVLENIRAVRTFRSKTTERVNLRLAFSTFALGVLLNEDNDITAGNLSHWTQTGAISYCTSRKFLPPLMRLNGPMDKNALTGSEPLSVIQILDSAKRVGDKLKLREVDFNMYGNLESVIKRHLKEFCLPSKLNDVIKRSLEHTNLMEVKYEFGVSHVTMPSLDVRALSLILFAIKYLYGLDDQTEYYRSASSKKANRDNPGAKRRFVFSDWLRLSRMRARLMCRHDSVLHQRFSRLFPEVEMSDEASLDAMEDLQNWTREIRSNQLNGIKKRVANFYENLSLELRNAFPEAAAPRKRERPDLTETKTPIQEFTRFHAVRDEIVPEEKKGLEELSTLRKTRLDLRAVPKGAERVDIKLSEIWPRGQLVRRGKPTNMSFTEVKFNPAGVIDSDKYYDVRNEYWITGYIRPIKPGSNRRQLDNDYILGNLPENFAWVLNYFSCASLVPIYLIFEDLVCIEDEILKQQKGFFGKFVFGGIN